MRILVISCSDRGQTAKIARYITQRCRNHGDIVELIDGRAIPATIDLAGFDAVIVGAAVYSGRFERHASRFVRANRARLQQMPSGFFGVSLGEADPDPVVRAGSMRTIDRLLETTGWRPTIVATFAGSIDDRPDSWLMRLHCTRLPLPGISRIRASRNAPIPDGVGYTNWSTVSRFADSLAELATRDDRDRTRDQNAQTMNADPDV